MAILNFDASTVDPSSSFDPLPAGWYNVMVTASDLVPTSSGTGTILKVTYKVLDGQHANRVVFGNLNIRNENPVAQEIATKQLSALAHAVGVLRVADSQQLHGIPLKIRLKIKTDISGQYDPKNEISGYKGINEDTPGSPTGASASAPVGFAKAAPVVPAAPKGPVPVPAPDRKTFEVCQGVVLVEDGWNQHPNNHEYFYKGKEVLKREALLAKFGAPTPAPAVPDVPGLPGDVASGVVFVGAGGAAPQQPWSQPNSGEAVSQAEPVAPDDNTPPWAR